MVNLTNKFVASVKPPRDKNYIRLWDDTIKGFGLRVTDKDVKSFFLKVGSPYQRKPSRIRLVAQEKCPFTKLGKMLLNYQDYSEAVNTRSLLKNDKATTQPCRPSSATYQLAYLEKALHISRMLGAICWQSSADTMEHGTFRTSHACKPWVFYACSPLTYNWVHKKLYTKHHIYLLNTNQRKLNLNSEAIHDAR